MPFKDLLISGNNEASFTEKIADILLTPANALYTPQNSKIWNGNRVKVIPDSMHQLNIESNENYWSFFPNIGRVAAVILSPVLIVPLGAMTLLGKKLKLKALDKDPRAKIYNQLCNEYLRLKTLNSLIMKNEKKVSETQVEEYFRLSKSLQDIGSTYWDKTKKAGEPAQSSPDFSLQLDFFIQTNPLFIAIRKDKDALASKLIKDNSINFTDRSSGGLTALHFAIHRNKPELIKELIKVQPSLLETTDKNDRTPLHIAIYLNFPTNASLLIDSGANINAQDFRDESPLHLAVQNENLDAIKLLIKNKASLLVRDQDGNNPIMAAYKTKNFEVIKVLMENISSLDELKEVDLHNNSYLHLAIRTGSSEIVKLTYEAFKKNNLSTYIDFQNYQGNTPLHETTKILEKTNLSNTILEENFEGIVKFLIVNGANKSIKNRKNRTLVDYLSYYPNFILIKKIKAILT